MMSSFSSSFSSRQVLLLLHLITSISLCQAYTSRVGKLTLRSLRTNTSYGQISRSLVSLVVLESSQRQPRRNLPKRKRRRDGDDYETPAADDQDDVDSLFELSSSASTELRPLVGAKSKELGLDYWMDQEELRREQERELENRRRKAMRRKSPDQVPDEKLWEEVLNPYRQNWIGVISIVIVALAFIIQSFPDLINSPSISYPDL